MTANNSTPGNADQPNEPLAVIEKGKTVDVRVTLAEYNGRRYLDVRQLVVVDATGDRAPTRKGVTLAVDKIPELRAALEKAETAARDLGLLGNEPEDIEAAAA